MQRIPKPSSESWGNAIVSAYERATNTDIKVGATFNGG